MSFRDDPRYIRMDYKLELLCVPVTDVDKAKEFYVRAGFNADHDQRVNESLRFVQLTPPGSGCSICIGEGLTTMAPGSIEGLQLAPPPQVERFHAGTRREGAQVLSAGGRVLAVCAHGNDVSDARQRAYAEVGRLRFEGMQYRRDIAEHAG